MALKFKSIEKDGCTFQLVLLSGRSVARCVWKLTRPATAVLNGPIKLVTKLLMENKDEGGSGFDLEALLNSDVGDITEIIDKGTEALKEVFLSMDEDEFVDLLVTLFKGMTVVNPDSGEGSIIIDSPEAFDKAFLGVMPDTMFLIALEVMRFNRFPFLRRVTGDISELMSKINIFKEDSESANDTQTE